MADADLDAVIRQLARQQHKSLMAAAKKRRDRYNSLSGKAKDKGARDRYRQIGREVMLQASAAARRLQMSADNVADSYARSMRQAVAAAEAAAADAAAKATAPKKARKSKTAKKDR